MKIVLDSLARALTSRFILVLAAGCVVAPLPSVSVASATTSIKSSSISAGPSRAECIRPDVQSTSGLAYLQSLVASFDAMTRTNVTCLSAYLDNAQTWSQWDQPWVTSPVDGYSSWVAQDPHVRQLVLEVDLIPQNLQNVANPTKWEKLRVPRDTMTRMQRLSEEGWSLPDCRTP